MKPSTFTTTTRFAKYNDTQARDDSGRFTSGPSVLVGKIGERFKAAGFSLYLVGGSVRDRLLGRPVKDFDFTTDAPPDKTKVLLAAAKPTSLYTVGEKFGTIGGVFGKVPVEITTFRGEKYDPGSRKPTVQYSNSLKDDLARRDFTINAIAQDVVTGDLVDPFGGRQDLKDGLIRAVGDPGIRFAEDPLRLLRAIRFASRLDFQIDPGTEKAVVAGADGLHQISRERIMDEVSKILVSSKAGHGVTLLSRLDLLDNFLPKGSGLGHADCPTDAFKHTVRVVDRVKSDPVLRWAALFHGVGSTRAAGEKMSADILHGLRANLDLTARVSRLVGLNLSVQQHEGAWSDGDVRRLAREAGSDLGRLLELASADASGSAVGGVRRLRSRSKTLETQAASVDLDSPLDGDDLMRLLGRKPGPWVKQAKSYLLDLVLDGSLSPGDKHGAADVARARFGESSR